MGWALLTTDEGKEEMIYLSTYIVIGIITVLVLIKLFSKETYTVGDILLFGIIWPAVIIALLEKVSTKYLSPIFSKIIHEGKKK